MLCSLLESYHCFTGSRCLHLRIQEWSVQLPFLPEDRVNRFLRNTGKHLPNYTAFHPKGQYSSKWVQWNLKSHSETLINYLLLTAQNKHCSTSQYWLIEINLPLARLMVLKHKSIKGTYTKWPENNATEWVWLIIKHMIYILFMI
jgi:hypothetical protein